MGHRFGQVQPYVRRFSEWAATLDSRPREKQLAIGAGIVGLLFLWFAVALASPVLLAGLPLTGVLLMGSVRAQRRLQPAEGFIELEADELPGTSLLTKLTLTPPPPPVGRTTASYVYEPPEVEPERIPLDDPPDDEVDLGDRSYEVVETLDSRPIVRHTSPSLFGATDYALELHLRTRGTEIEVVRLRGDTRESVLRFSRDRPPEGAQSAKSLLELFGYPVGRWKGPGA
jgi:hypothetical protein